MPDPTFIPAIGSVINLDAADVSVIGNVTNVNQSGVVNRKAVFGAPHTFALEGPTTVTVECQGHVSAELAAGLQAAFTKRRIGWSVQVGVAAQATDGGLYSGTGVVSAYNLTANAEGEWDWSMNMEVSGETVYTAATPA